MGQRKHACHGAPRGRRSEGASCRTQPHIRQPSACNGPADKRSALRREGWDRQEDGHTLGAFLSASRSPSAQNGWYCVYLFRSDGSGVYLALAHGSTSFLNGMFVPRADGQLADLLTWARTTLGDALLRDPRVQSKIDLGEGPGKLAKPYEKSTVAGIWYPADNLPDEAQLTADAVMFAGLLGQLYCAQDQRRMPGEIAPEIIEAVEAVDEIAKPLMGRSRAGQGRGLSGPERQAVERRAMELAKSILEREGFTVEDHSATASYDFLASKNGCKTVVEVKGTTGGLGPIMLTANEVTLHQSGTINNALFVVHSIDLDRHGPQPIASGGTVHRLQPWRLNPDQLKPMAFEYALLAE
ncbi:MrcB family domain-containing protein [Sphingobium sp. EP60837]|uniref:MrcB family domain-containing protein n=1 Tax=Sphingobium sp. EP60837 TaxID=1855519 RepID=UPI0009EDE070|nr:DUF3578 domain-containing protein [Sphingobium sp. EP60837]